MDLRQRRRPRMLTGMADRSRKNPKHGIAESDISGLKYLKSPLPLLEQLQEVGGEHLQQLPTAVDGSVVKTLNASRLRRSTWASAPATPWSRRVERSSACRRSTSAPPIPTRFPDGATVRSRWHGIVRATRSLRTTHGKVDVARNLRGPHARTHDLRCDWTMANLLA